VTESVTESGRCDFCQVNESKHTINGGLWWLCTPCMEEQYANMQVVVFGGEEE
jgi:hypothetical protein